MLAALWTSLIALEPVIRLLPSAVVCPRIEEVERQLAVLLPSARALEGRADAATLEDVGDRLRVTLVGDDGTLLGRRELTTKASCGELASAVALVLAMWESDVHPEFVLEPPATPPSVNVAPTPPPVAVVPVAPPPPAVAPAPPPALPPRPSAAPPTPRSRAALDLGAALGVVAGSNALEGPLENTFTWSAALVGAWLPAARGWGAHLTLFGSGERVAPLPVGEARWRRAGGSIGPVYRSYPSRRVPLDLHADVLAAALGVRGTGLERAADDWSLDWGGAAGVRVGWAVGTSWRPWWGLAVQVWPRKQVAYTRPSGDGTSLPPAEVTLSFGMSFAAWPAPADDSL